MSLTPTSSSNSDSSNWNQINNMIRQLNNEQVTKVFKQVGGVDALVEGRLPNDLGYGTLLYDQNGIPLIYMAVVNGQPVLKVAPPGTDVTTAADSELLFNSAQNVFKVAETLSGSIAVDFGAFTAGGSDTTFRSTSSNSLTLAHDLGFVPAIEAYIYDSSKYIPISNGSVMMSAGWSTTNPSVTFQGTTVGGMGTAYWSIAVDSTNVTISGIRSGFARAGVSVAAITFPSASIKVYCKQETAS